MVNKLKKLWYWFLSLFTGKRRVETVPFSKLKHGEMYIRPHDWKMVSKKREWKRHVEIQAKLGVEKDGGTFLSINWKKRKIHYLDKHGNPMTG